MDKNTIQVYSAEQLAQKMDKTKQAIHAMHRRGAMTKIEFIWESEGRQYRGKFYLPLGYCVVKRDNII